MQIRYATRKEVHELSELFCQAAEEHPLLAHSCELQHNGDWTAYAERWISGREGRIFVSEKDGAIAGFISVTINVPLRDSQKSFLKRICTASRHSLIRTVRPSRVGIIENCYVIPSMRRQGIGSQLFRSAVKWFKVKKIKRVELSIGAQSEDVRLFWQKMGFELFRMSLFRQM